MVDLKRKLKSEKSELHENIVWLKMEEQDGKWAEVRLKGIPDQNKQIKNS